MKYIKLFEQEMPIFGYWRINCKSMNHILIALKKLGLTPEDTIYKDIKSEYEELNIQFSHHFYILRCLSDGYEEYWYYSVDISQFKNKFKFNGKIKVEDWEVNAG